VIVTKPLTLTSEHVHINAQSDFGEIVIEALDPAGQSIARSKPIHRDSLDTKIEWEGAGLKGIVTFRISLKNACLYALWCE